MKLNFNVKKLCLLFLMAFFLLAQITFVFGAENPPEIASRSCHFTR